MNYAEKGWSNTQELVGLVELLKHADRKPDVVLFYDGGTEAFAAYQGGEADVHSKFAMFRNFLDNWGKTPQLTPYEQQVLALQDRQFPNLGSMYQRCTTGVAKS